MHGADSANYADGAAKSSGLVQAGKSTFGVTFIGLLNSADIQAISDAVLAQVRNNLSLADIESIIEQQVTAYNTGAQDALTNAASIATATGSEAVQKVE